MAVVPQGGFTFRQYRWPKFSGGFTFTQAQPSDCVTFNNIDMQRDQHVRARKGIKRLNVAGALGSAKVMGLAILAAGNTPVLMSKRRLIVAKADKTFYHANLTDNIPNPTIPFSSFTVPDAPTGSAYVYMDAISGTGGATSLVMSHASWTGGLVLWDGSAAAATYATGSPQSTTVCVHSDGRVYAVPNADSLSLRFSESDNPNSWPVANAIGITAQYGPIQRLVSLTDRLLIFCKDGLLSLQGDPTTQPYVSVVHPSIGCEFPSTVSVFGNTIVFLHGGYLYQYSGGASLLSDALRGIGLKPELPQQDVPRAGALSPFHYMLHFSTTTSPTTLPFSLVYERVRYGQWAVWSYDKTSAIGSTPSDLGCVVWAGGGVNAFVLDGGDGNLYHQGIYLYSDQGTVGGVAPGDLLVGGTDADGVNVRVSLQTRMEGLGDDLMVKTWRRLQVLGSGTNATCKLYLYDSTGTFRTITLASGATLPLDLNTPAADGSSTAPPTEFTQIQVSLEADNLVLKDMLLDWRPSRYSLLNYT